MAYKSLGDYSFCILITLDFIKPYGNIVNLYAHFFIKIHFSVFILKDLLSCGSLVWTIISELC